MRSQAGGYAWDAGDWKSKLERGTSGLPDTVHVLFLDLGTLTQQCLAVTIHHPVNSQFVHCPLRINQQSFKTLGWGHLGGSAS